MKQDIQYIYQNELEKTSFQQDMAHGDFNNLPRRTASDKALCNKAFNIARNLKDEQINANLLQQIINFLIRSLQTIN